MAKKFHNIFAQIQAFEKHVADLEGQILKLEQKIEQLIQVERNHLIRVKNHEEISDEFIYSGRKYQDLTPEKAWKLYCNKDYDFLLIDVSDKDYTPEVQIPEAHKIPWDEFPERFYEISSRTTPILIISEDGTNSVLACEYLTNRGYYNCSNVSGGYKFWKGLQISKIKSA